MDVLTCLLAGIAFYSQKSWIINENKSQADEELGKKPERAERKNLFVNTRVNNPSHIAYPLNLWQEITIYCEHIDPACLSLKLFDTLRAL